MNNREIFKTLVDYVFSKANNDDNFKANCSFVFDFIDHITKNTDIKTGLLKQDWLDFASSISKIEEDNNGKH